MLVRCLPGEPACDARALRKQDRRQQGLADRAAGTERPAWSAPLYRYTSNLGRQVPLQSARVSRTSLATAL
jgi:hypothetical protein